MVRGCVLVAASVLLGTAAHVGASGGVGVRLGPVLVMAVLLAMAVSGVLGAGAWLAARVSRWGWSSPVEDVSAGVGLVTSQLLVHWLGQPLPASLPPLASGHGAHHGPVDGTMAVQSAVHAGHAGGWGMAVAHASAALAVGLLLRWLEASLFALAAVLVTVGRAVHLALASLATRAAPLPALVERSCRSAVPRVPDRPAILAALQASVVRRGPPVGMAFA